MSASLLLPLVLLGCQTDDLIGGDGAAPYEPGPTCAYEGTPVAADEDPGIGATLTEQLLALSGDLRSTLQWDHTGETTELTHGFSARTEDAAWYTGELVDAETGEPVDPAELDSGVDPSTACPPYLGIPGTLTLVTADGLLDESLSVEVSSSAPLVGRLDVDVAYESLAGTPPLGIDAGSWDTVVVHVSVNLGDGTRQGELAYTAERVTDDSDEGQVDDFARWPAGG